MIEWFLGGISVVFELANYIHIIKVILMYKYYEFETWRQYLEGIIIYSSYQYGIQRLVDFHLM